MWISLDFPTNAHYTIVMGETEMTKADVSGRKKGETDMKLLFVLLWAVLIAGCVLFDTLL